MPYDVLSPSLAVAAPATTVGVPLTSVGETLASYRAELVARMQARKDITNGGADFTRVDSWINQGYRNVSAMIDLKELWGSVGLTTVAGKNLYLIPAVVAWINRLAVSDSTDFRFRGGKPLGKIDLDRYRELPDTAASFGLVSPIIPAVWFRYVRMVVLWPSPDSVFLLPMDFRVRPAKLVVTTDSPILPEEFHESILHAGLERAWSATQNPAKAALSRNEKVAALRDIINTDAEENTQLDGGLAPVRYHSDIHRED